MSSPTSKVVKTIAAAVTPTTGSSYYYGDPSTTAVTSKGMDMSQVGAFAEIAIWINDAGDGANSTSSAFTVEYSNDGGTTWFTPLASGVDSFTAVTTAASLQVRKPSVRADRMRVKVAVSSGSGATGAKTITVDWVSDPRGGSYSA